jgi:hypothetical protein
MGNSSVNIIAIPEALLHHVRYERKEVVQLA